MTFGFTPPPVSDAPSRLSRTLEPAEWAAAGIPLLRDPRETVAGLCERHSPRLSTAVVAVMGPDERLVASASFDHGSTRPDGWEFRNALLSQLRRVIPHDLRRRSPVRTAVLLYCRTGGHGWTEIDGAWMWGLRDACTLHGLRCGAYVTLTRSGWQVLGEGRRGRRPAAVSATSVEPVPANGKTTTAAPAASAPSSDVSSGASSSSGQPPSASSAAAQAAAATPAAGATPVAQTTAAPMTATPGRSSPATGSPAPAAQQPVPATPLGVGGTRAARKGTPSTSGRGGSSAAAAARAGAGAEAEAGAPAEAAAS